MSKPNVAIMTSFTYHAAGYSLVNIIRSHIRMLHRAHYNPHLLLCTGYPEGDVHEYKEAAVHRIVPQGHLNKEYTDLKLTDEHVKLKDDTVEAMVEFIDEYDINVIFTHDLIFLKAHWPYGSAIQEISKLRPMVKWMHWIHSVPSGMEPIWDINRYGPAHRIVFPNRTDSLRVAEQFRGWQEQVLPIHHVKDIREFASFSSATCDFIDEYDLMSADVIQIYPASVDRIEAKGLRYVMRVFAAFKTVLRKSVRLVVCNQWCNIDAHRKTVQGYLDLGQKWGLTPDKDLIFTSRFQVDRKPNWEVGIPEKMVSELMLLGNLFFFATNHESFGLVLPEASLMGGALVVSNGNLDMMREITGNNGLFWPLPSNTVDWKADNEKKHFTEVAKVIMHRLETEMGIKMKTHFRQRFNMDFIWRTQLEPAMLALINEAT